MYKLHLGNCLEVMKTMADNSVDSIVTDPPYGFQFMGKKWDYDVPSVEIWSEALRVLKPGGHLLAFSGARTYHRMVVKIEDAGFEIRDQIMWLYGSGFPKSLDVSKAIDKSAGAVRKVISEMKTNSGGMAHISKTNSEHGFRPKAYTGSKEDKTAKNVIKITEPATDDAKKWEGWGTALKPAHEPIVLARKPLAEKSVAENVLKYGVGGINIDDCRIVINPEIDDKRLGGKGSWKTEKAAKNVYGGGFGGKDVGSSEKGRFPANVIHDGSEEVVKRFPTDNGSAARFFYCAKASKKDRDEGLENTKSYQYRQNGFSSTISDTKLPRVNNHPTVKPTELMKYLCRLVTPKGGTVLDPFMGSGSTGKAAIIEGFNFIGIEMEQEYLDIAEKRIQDAEPKHDSVMSIIDNEDNIS